MNAVILHGTGADHTFNWFPWLKDQLEDRGLDVWVPDLPGADKPDLHAYTSFLYTSGHDFSDNLIIGHSSGAVAILALLESLPEGQSVDTVILVGAFRGSLGWESLSNLEVTHDYDKIRARAKRFILIHSDNDPYCPLDGAKWIAEQLRAEFIMIPNSGHFSEGLDSRFKEFPELLRIIERVVLR